MKENNKNYKKHGKGIIIYYEDYKYEGDFENK